jgi:hypothetical protein
MLPISWPRSSSLDCRRFTSLCDTASVVNSSLAPSSSAAGCNSVSTWRRSQSRSCGRMPSSRRSLAPCAGRSTLRSFLSVCISDGSSADDPQPRRLRTSIDEAVNTRMLREARGGIERRRSMTSAVDPKPMSRTKAMLYAIGSPVTLVALVLLPVGKIDWIPG